MPRCTGTGAAWKMASVQNTKKITRAMELIAATRVVKRRPGANESRPYSEHITR